MKLWQEKAGARYMYYICTESGVATRTDPPRPTLSLSTGHTREHSRKQGIKVSPSRVFEIIDYNRRDP